MTKLIFTALATVALAIGTAGTASADEAGFIEAIDEVGHYSTIYPQDTIAIGRQVCTIFDNGGRGPEAVAWVRQKYNGPGTQGSSENYYATLFAQAASVELCPDHRDVIGQI